MYQEILEHIKAYDTIIISRHVRPDSDALGSQFGLKEIIKANFPSKRVYCVGDYNKAYSDYEMDVISDDTYKGALFIFCDVSSIEIIALEQKYELADKVIVIDHHESKGTIKNAINYIDPLAGACSQLIEEFAYNCKLNIPIKASEMLYCGIIGDTNRFNYSLSKRLFESAGRLIDRGIDYPHLYDKIYSESEFFVKMKADFTSKFKITDKGVAYIKSDESIFDTYKVEFPTISRSMVNCMANLKNVEIWANFTQNPETHKIVCEFRSKTTPIVDIAKKYGGGGHALACGCTIDNFEIADFILEDLGNLLKERK